MSLSDPLPFKLKIPGEDTIDWQGVRSISYRLDGLLSLSDDAVTLEWKARRHTEHVGIGGVKDVVDESPIGTMEISRALIARVRVVGWFRPRLQMWARQIDAFEGIPSARPGMLSLRIRRPDRRLARAVAEALTPSQSALPPGGSQVARS
jgi:hypothetical protein